MSHNRRGKDLTCIYTDERPDLPRELPNWMFDERYCAGMSLGSPQISIEALNALATVLAASSKSTKRGSRSRPSESKEAIQDRRQLALDVESRHRTPIRPTPNAKGLIEALADLLLEALGERTMAIVGIEGGAHEPGDQR